MIRVFFAPPRTGKTTVACKLALKNKRKYKNCYLNFSNTVPDVYTCDFDKLGEWTFPPSSYICADESGIDFNSRKTLKMPQSMIAWLKLHGHYKCDLDFFSQSHDDMDVNIRRLAVEYWLLYRIGPWTLGRRIFKRIGVDSVSHQIVDQYRMASILWLLIWPLQLGWPFQKKFTLTFRPFYYKYFDSWERSDLPLCDFPVMSSTVVDKSPMPADEPAFDSSMVFAPRSPALFPSVCKKIFLRSQPEGAETDF